MNQRGFSLIELVIVIAIISTLACIAIPRLSQAQDSAAVLKTRMDLIAIDGAVAAYTVTKGTGASGVSLIQLTASGFLPAEPKPPVRLAGLLASEQYYIDGSLGRAYVLLTAPGKTVIFYSDTDLNR